MERLTFDMLMSGRRYSYQKLPNEMPLIDSLETLTLLLRKE